MGGQQTAVLTWEMGFNFWYGRQGCKPEYPASHEHTVPSKLQETEDEVVGKCLKPSWHKMAQDLEWLSPALEDKLHWHSCCELLLNGKLLKVGDGTAQLFSLVFTAMS